VPGTSVHVIYNDPSWRVEHEGTTRSHHYTQDAAKYTARSLAKQINAELIVHATDGTIAARESFAGDQPLAH